MIPQRKSFSQKLPVLQLAWDSTSLGVLKECPRKYQLSILEGRTPRDESVHLTFGLHYHSAHEHYHRRRAAGDSHDAALLSAVRQTMLATWNESLNRPWFSDHKTKNRYTLLRSIVWHLDQFADDPAETVILANGQPAVELSFRFETGHVSRATDEQYLLCGHLDRLAKFSDAVWDFDYKTTASTLTGNYFEKYSPDNQCSMYSFGGSVCYQLPVAGVIIDAAQVAVTFSEFQRGFVNRTHEQLQEWFQDTMLWISMAEHYASTGYWPMNDKSCGNYGGCPFREICSKSPSTRQQWIEAGFTVRVWDPLVVRGDI